MGENESTTNNFWDLTQRPYTQLKLRILKNYLSAWSKILFATAAKHRDWASYQELYYVDCFAGRGKYDLDGKADHVNGSPLIALECASALQEQAKYSGIKLNCIFIENSRLLSGKLEEFCKPYEHKVDYQILKKTDFNEIIPSVLRTVGRHPAFFFIDPDGIKELKKDSLSQIVSRSGPTDILLNYIKGGVERIAGLARKRLPEILAREVLEKDMKTIKALTDFYGLGIFDNLDTTEKARLKEWTKSVLESSRLKEVAVFDMPYRHRADNIYYLLFASRKPVAKKIIVDIFKNAKREGYDGQGRLMDVYDNESFDI